MKKNYLKIIIDKNNKPVVYKPPGGSCSKAYSGRKIRKFKIKLGEHERSFNKMKLDSRYTNHLMQANPVW